MTVLGLPDGRRLAYEVMGDPAGSPVLVLHGTPGSSRQLASLSGPAWRRWFPGIRRCPPNGW